MQDSARNDNDIAPGPTSMEEIRMQAAESRTPQSKNDRTEGREYRRVHHSARPGGSVVRIGDVPFGGDRFPVIAGPCAVESRAQIDRAARLVAERGAGVLRGGAFKPRTSPYSFQGLGLEGLELMRRASDAHDIPLVTEVLSPEDVERMAPTVDAFQVGARNMQNFPLLRTLATTARPVLLKRSFGATLREWLLAAEYLLAGGNDRVILCERGVRGFGEQTRFTLDLAGAAWAREETHLPVVVDPSHATGTPSLIPQMARAALAAGLDGVMVEVHPDPEQARSDADQALTAGEFEDLMAGLGPIAEALGRRL